MNCSFFYAIWRCFIVITPCMLGGITLGFSTIALPQLDLSLDAASWFSCLFTVAAPFGCLMTGFVIDRYGRKRALMLCNIPAILGWLIMAIRRDTMILFLGRILTGLSAGAGFFPAQVYLAEFVDVDPMLIHLRTSFTNWPSSATAFGFLLVILFGALFRYNVVAFLSFVIAFLSFCCICIFIPESPIWLYQKGKYGDAEWSLKRLNLSSSFENLPLLSTKKKENDFSILKKLARRDIYVPLFITTGCWVLNQASGASIYTSYLVELIDTSGSYSLQDSYLLSVVSGVLQFVATVAVIFVVSLTGVRRIAVGSSLGIAVCMLTYGVAFNFTDSFCGTLAHNMSVAAVWLGTFFYGFGFASIPRAILAELFPTDAKGFAVVPTIAMYTFQSIVVKVHPSLSANYGGIPYIVYAAFSVLYALFLYYYLPETVGKTAMQINRELRDNH